jgi:hypothetical protein
MKTPALVAVGIGALALGSIAPSAARAATQPAVPFARPLHLGSDGLDVARLQSALIRANVRPAFRGVTTHFGVYTRYEVQRFQRSHAILASGVVGRPTKARLWPFYTPYARGVELRAAAWRAHMAALAAARARATASLHSARVQRVLAATSDARAHSWEMAYSQSWTRTSLPAFPSVPRATDCSGYAIWTLRHAFLSGSRPPMGWTGTLGVEGWRVPASTSSMHVGDLVFYGGYPHGHVAVYIGGGLVSSHGSPGIHVLRWNADSRGVGQVRRYFP